MKKEYKNPEFIIEEMEVDNIIICSIGQSKENAFGDVFGENTVAE